MRLKNLCQLEANTKDLIGISCLQPNRLGFTALEKRVKTVTVAF